jgi:hypothetical protein
MKRLIVIVLAFFLIPSLSFSHSGRTDSQGGHHNRKTGGYHYHGGPKSTPSPATTTIEQKSRVYHGNIKSKKLHQPSCRYYNCGNCTAVFSSIEEAIQAGYIPCKVCRP